MVGRVERGAGGGAGPRTRRGGGDVFDEGGRAGPGESESESSRGISSLFVGGRVGPTGGREGPMDGFATVGLSGFDGFSDGGSDGPIDGFVGGGAPGPNPSSESSSRGISSLLSRRETLGGGDARRPLSSGMRLRF